ncbi:MAG: hypothetical protein ACI9JL_001130 [Paracoccaceae bacterium]
MIRTGRNSRITSPQNIPVLDEIAAENATGNIKNVYAAIESALGVKLVNLVYRHLATVPGALEWAWSTVGPSFENGVFAEQSGLLGLVGDTSVTSRVSFDQAGLSEEEGNRVVETLSAYNRANPMNALSLRVIAMALEAGRPALWRAPVSKTTGTKITGEVTPGELSVLLPMAPLDGLPPATMDSLYRLARLTTGQDRGLVPSLFRHFTAWPALLTALADWLEPLAKEGVIEGQVARISALADEIAQDIFAQLDRPEHGAVLPDAATRETLLQTIEIFPPAICRMIVIGGLLHKAVRP